MVRFSPFCVLALAVSFVSIVVAQPDGGMGEPELFDNSTTPVPELIDDNSTTPEPELINSTTSGPSSMLVMAPTAAPSANAMPVSMVLEPTASLAPSSGSDVEGPLTTVDDFILNDPDLTTLAAAFNQSGLVGVLCNDCNFTVFAYVTRS